MSKRMCDRCGKEKNVSGGKTCEKEHFVCYDCRDIGLLDSGRVECPICKTKLK
jgi:transposase-like protein